VLIDIIEGRPRDLGGFSVRRVLPSPQRQMVGPFIFFDAMGPATFAPGTGVDVRPHPHVGLATVTWLFEGELMHRDSLGIVQRIRPGDVNWMTAGRGIVHSERTPPEVRRESARLHGIQCWVALPKSAEDTAPAFQHCGADELPRQATDGVALKVIAGELFGLHSPVKVASSLGYAAVTLEPGAQLSVPPEHEERGVFCVDGSVDVDGTSLAEGQLGVLLPGAAVWLRCRRRTRLMILGGAPSDGPREIWWNFVASSRARIDAARERWRNDRFPAVPGEPERIPLPEH
jgi:hypothetical protein